MGTDQWIVVPFWLPIRPVILSLVGRRIEFLGKKYGTMYRQIKSKDSFRIVQKVPLPTKVISLRLRIQASTGRLISFLGPAEKERVHGRSKSPTKQQIGGFFYQKNEHV